MHGAPQVDVEESLQIDGGRLLEGTGLPDPGVGHNGIERASGDLQHMGHRHLHRMAVRDVHDH